MIDQAELIHLQRELLDTAIRCVPEGVTAFSIHAVQTSGVGIELSTSRPLEIPAATVESLEKIFEMHRDVDPLVGVRCQFREKPDHSWSMTVSYDYPPSA